MIVVNFSYSALELHVTFSVVFFKSDIELVLRFSLFWESVDLDLLQGLVLQ
jgi:hypothetical protein